MQKMGIFLNLEGHNFEFFFNRVITCAYRPPFSQKLNLLNANSLLSHFLQEFFNVYVLFLYFLMEIGVVFFEKGFLFLQMFEVLDVVVDFVGLELDVLFGLDELLFYR
jgi:hypothetical protein